MGGWKNLIPSKETKRWMTLKVEDDVYLWIKKVAQNHKSTPTRVLYAIVRAAFDEERATEEETKRKK